MYATTKIKLLATYNIYIHTYIFATYGMGPEVFYSRVLGFRVLLGFTLRISGSGFRRRLWVLGHPVLDGASVCELYQH